MPNKNEKIALKYNIVQYTIIYIFTLNLIHHNAFINMVNYQKLRIKKLKQVNIYKVLSRLKRILINSPQ